MIPDGGLRDDLDLTLRFPVPVLDSERCPLGCCVIAPLLHGGKPFADHARTPDLLRRAGRWWSTQMGGEAESSNERE